MASIVEKAVRTAPIPPSGKVALRAEPRCRVGHVSFAALGRAHSPGGQHDTFEHRRSVHQGPSRVTLVIDRARTIRSA